MINRDRRIAIHRGLAVFILNRYFISSLFDVERRAGGELCDVEGADDPDGMDGVHLLTDAFLPASFNV